MSYSSSSSSSNNHDRSTSLTSLTSSSSLQHRHRSLNSIRELESTTTSSSGNGLSIHGQRSMAQAADISNRFQQLHVHSDINIATSHATTLPTESLAEEELVEQLKAIINEFMTRPGRRYSYDTTMRWTVDHSNEIHYTVIIKINQSTH